MSFASSAREEIAQRSPTKECCVRAATYGIACFAKYFDARGLVLQTEQPHTVQLAQQLFARCGIRGEILEKPRASGVLYEFNIRDAEQVARLYEVHGKANILHDPYYNPNLTMDREDFSESDDLRGLKEGRITVQWRE